MFTIANNFTKPNCLFSTSQLENFRNSPVFSADIETALDTGCKKRTSEHWGISPVMFGQLGNIYQNQRALASWGQQIQSLSYCPATIYVNQESGTSNAFENA